MELFIAAIGAIATIIGTAATIYGLRAPAKRLKREEQRIQRASKSLSHSVEKRIGYTARKLLIKFDTVDTVGTVLESRSYWGVSANEGIQLSLIPGNTWITAPEGVIDQPPKLELIGDCSKNCSMRYLSSSDKRCDFEIVFDEPLNATDPPFDYAVSVVYKNHTLMHRREVEEAYRDDAFKKDYCLYESVTPLDELVLEVTFPPGLAFITSPSVFYGGEGLVHKLELDRVRHGFSKIPNGAIFSINKPLLGFSYLIYWDTPE